MPSTLYDKWQQLLKRSRSTLSNAMPGQGVSREDVLNCYHLLLGRVPESDQVIDQKLSANSQRGLVMEFVSSEEFRSRFPEVFIQDKPWVMVESQEQFRIWVNLSDLAVSGAIIRDRFELDETAFVHTHVKPGMTALDIGANLGFYSLLMAQCVGPNGRVIGFEPLPFLHEMAMKSVSENGFDQCIIHNVALGTEVGEAQLVYAPNSTNWGGAYLCFDGSVPADHTAVSVPVRPLSTHVSADRPIDFIKIDVEGAEPMVLEAAADLLRKNRPVILSEIHADQLMRVSGTTPREYICLLGDIGYGCRRVEKGGSMGAALTGAESLEIANVAFVPK